MLLEAINNGICKINLATETKNAFMIALKKRLANNSEIDLRIVFPDAIKAVTDLIVKKLKVVNSVWKDPKTKYIDYKVFMTHKFLN